MEASLTSGLKIAIVGCGHGQLDTIYATAEVECTERGWDLSDLDFLVICGDFQAVRNDMDLNCMSVPHRYRKLGDFHRYYSGAARAPVLTLVIGGNHEASNYFFELYHGGWLAPNIYYLGAAGVVRYGPWRIAGISGIYDSRDYQKPHTERLPYNGDDIRSVYHVRAYDVQRLLLHSPADIMLSHDWPAWVELFGDHKSLYAMKPHFLTSALADRLGSKPSTRLLDQLRPSYWFSGHMHVHFSASIDLQEHRGIQDSVQRLKGLPEKLKPVLARSFRDKIIFPPPSSSGHLTTNKTEFLALDKVGSPTYRWLRVKSLDEQPHSHGISSHIAQRTAEGKFSLQYDEEWLAITRACAPALRVPDPDTLVVPPSGNKISAKDLDEHRDWVRKNVVEKGLLGIPLNFQRHAPVQSPDLVVSPNQQPLEYPNQQTAQFCDLLQIPNKFTLSSGSV